MSGAVDVVIRPCDPGDAAEIAGIYNHYVADSYVTFETEPVAVEEMAQRMADTVALPLPWLVAESSAGVIGYAYASRWHRRHAYRFSVESTIYLHPGHTGKGVGLPLYGALMEAIRRAGLHTVIAGIALPNDRSIRLHEALGFGKVAHFEQMGYKQDRWIDVAYWQLMP